MDDGCLSIDKDYGYNKASISAKRLAGDAERLMAIKDAFRCKGLEVNIGVGSGSIFFTRKSIMDLSSRIAKYVPECMQYKLPESHRGRYVDFTLKKGQTSFPLPVKVVKLKCSVEFIYISLYIFLFK
jgi:hypothetical protein